MRLLMTIGFLISLVLPAQAQIVPDLYAKIRLAGFENPVELRRSGNKTRIDIVSGGILQTYIADQDRGLLISLVAAGGKRTALVFPLDRAPALLPLPIDLMTLQDRGATLKPIGSSLQAGQACRLIEFKGYLNQAGVVCVDTSGVILQMTQKGRGTPLFEVAALASGPQDAKWFVIPSDYQTVALPAIGGAAARGEMQGLNSEKPSEKPPVKSPFRDKK
ncbi:hypothetical protein AEYBE204_18455 [Asticcacaulis sp. YBE204]|nr:hypothetical protein AEYBE204_18455 [Asticcacaulis sp. YBE204]